MSGPPITKLFPEPNLSSSDYDSIVLVISPEQTVSSDVLKNTLANALKYDKAFDSEVSVLPVNLMAERLVYAPTGPLDVDYDDVRCFSEAAQKGIKRALKAGSKKPLLVVEPHPRFENAELVGILGALLALYTPLQVREHDPSKTQKVDYLGVWHKDNTKLNRLIQEATMLENGRRVACDIGDADPERMTPKGIEQYITSVFSNTSIKLNVISDIEQITKEFPLFEAVNRAASMQERHKGRIVFMEYNPPESVEKTLYIVGKGVTYDTGGADVKINGNMLGMSRDKCGAAAVIGFMQIVNLLKPKNIKVVAGVGLVRNSIGSNSYVADEVITARSGKRVRVINTDAEGRMIMCDILCKFKEEAVKAVNPHIYTIATLTGHACLTVGDGYSIVIDNGPALKANHCYKLQEASNAIGDLFEISTLRKEDIASHRGVMEGDDVVQGQTKPSSQCARGHQGPAGFLLLASGLDSHGSGHEFPLKYSHLDIASSSGFPPEPSTGAPVLALAQAYLFDSI